jgi:hypothetical protein
MQESKASRQLQMLAVGCPRQCFENRSTVCNDAALNPTIVSKWQSNQSHVVAPD